MPPVGRPRPEKPVAASLVSSLEAGLDRAAAAKPNPGRAPLHRLNRTEYANAIRDMLALDVDVRNLLPADDTDEHGFDNVAEVLTVSPALMERYLFAARKIGRLALGYPTGPGVELYPLPRMLTQDDRLSEDLPFGSRGGAAVRHYFPRGRRVQDQGQAEVEPLRLHPRPGPAAGSRRAARWCAREALHRRRPIGSESPAAQLLGRDARQHDLRDLRARCRRGPGSDGRGQGGHAHRRRVLYASDLGIRRRAAAGPDRLSPRGQRAVRRPRRGRQHRDRRTVQDHRARRYAQPPEDPASARRAADDERPRARSRSCRRSPGAPIAVR